jgi:protein-S-isoprenylcysteine O-methyltransferase Ste14
MNLEETIDSAYQANDKSLSAASVDFLRTSAKWAKFLAIVGFVLIGILIVFSLLFSSMISNLNRGVPAGVITVVYIIVGAIWLPPCIFLLRFANEINNGLDESDQNSIDAGFSALKSHFKYIGIFTIIILGFYALAFIGGILGGAMS